MFHEVFVFFATMLLIMFGFALSFYLMHQNANFRSRTDNSTIVNEGEMFHTFTKSVYETFLLMLTIIAPNDVYFSSSPLPAFVIMIYIVLIIVVSIVMINLLIAIMARRMDEIYGWKKELKMLEDLAIILYMEQRIKTKLGRYLMKFFVKTCFKYLISGDYNDFRYTALHSKVYVEVMENYA